MNAKTKSAFKYVTLYGQTAQQSPVVPGPIPSDFTFNSPVGMCMDHLHQLWVCDTGNDRVLVFDKKLSRILYVLSAADGLDFHMPFHVCPHPQKDLVYITDMGNSRVVVMAYAKSGLSFKASFGNVARNGEAPLQDPNGVAVVVQPDGKYFIHVNDEFFHTETERIRNRCVRYDEDGHYVSEFRTLIDRTGARHDLKWPQGLASDAKGHLYIANTGYYEILKCAADAPVDADYCIKADNPVVPHSFSQHGGMGMLNIMRYVGVIGNRVFVPDHVLNAISVYDLDGKPLTTLSGVRPSWNHGEEPVHSLTDPMYYALEDAALFNPYVICQGEASDIYFVSEPFSSRIVKLRIPRLGVITPPMEILAELGGRRNEPGDPGEDPQFNCVTAVTGLERLSDPVSAANDPEADLPAYLKYNPFVRGYLDLSKNLAAQYQFWFGDWSRRMLAHTGIDTVVSRLRLNLDAGNWRFKGYLKAGDDDFRPLNARLIDGYFAAGNLGMAVYYPKVPLLGQICPATPLLLVGNFNMGTISMYQIGLNGKLLNYGIPFGFYGTGDGFLRGPQGMAVSDDGEVFVVDSLNNRIAKWQILQTGQAVFIKNFTWNAGPDEVFTPTDVALYDNDCVVVTDQFNNRICFFDRSGEPLWQYGKEGYWSDEKPEGGDRFMLPTSLAIDGDYLILNDLVNRALKLFRIDAKKQTLDFEGGVSLFKLKVNEGGVWMPFFMYANDGEVHIADSTYNIVQVFKYA